VSAQPLKLAFGWRRDAISPDDGERRHLAGCVPHPAERSWGDFMGYVSRFPGGTPANAARMANTVYLAPLVV